MVSVETTGDPAELQKRSFSSSQLTNYLCPRENADLHLRVTGAFWQVTYCINIHNLELFIIVCRQHHLKMRSLLVMKVCRAADTMSNRGFKFRHVVCQVAIISSCLQFAR